MSRTPLVISEWRAWYDGFSFSPQEFYQDLEMALVNRQVPEAEISRVTWSESGLISAKREYLRITRGRLNFDICAAPFGTSFFFSWWLARLPSLVKSLAYLFLVGILSLGSFLVLANAIEGCAGQVAGGLAAVIVLFVLAAAVRVRVLGDEEAVCGIPILGFFYERLFQPVTYYQRDSEVMFQSVVHAAVLEVVDAWTKTKGLRALSERERQPTAERPSRVK